MSHPRLSDYTTRSSYQKSYASEHRDAINDRKRKWRAARKKAQKELDDIKAGKCLMVGNQEISQPKTK